MGAVFFTVKQTGAAPPDPPDYVRVALGLNSDISQYYQNDMPLNDRMKSGRDLEPSPNTGGVTIANFTLNANGYPTENIPKTITGSSGGAIARTLRSLIYTGQTLTNTGGERYPSGVYVLTWEGTATMRFVPGSDGTTTFSSGNRVERTVTTPTTAGLYVEILTSSAADPIRNIHCWLPGKENSVELFSDHWKDRAVGGVFRAMNFIECNDVDNAQVAVASRVTADCITQCSDNNGMSIEYIVACANELDQDLWLCIPCRASLPFVTFLLEYVRDNLASHLRVIIEGVGNEMWNGSGDFGPQHVYGWTQGTAMGLNLVGRFPGSTDPVANPGGYQGARFWTCIKWQAYMAAQWFAIAETVFGGKPSEVGHRYKRVLGAMVATPAVSDVLGESIYDEDINPLYDGEAPGELFDGFAVAPYFGVTTASMAAANHSLTTSQLVTQLAIDAVNETTTWFTAFGSLLTEHDCQLYCYEGGFGAAHATDSTATAMLGACRVHEDMYDVQTSFYDTVFSFDVQAFCHLGFIFKGGVSGHWGLLNHEYDDPSLCPTYRAHVDYVAYLRSL